MPVMASLTLKWSKLQAWDTLRESLMEKENHILGVVLRQGGIAPAKIGAIQTLGTWE